MKAKSISNNINVPIQIVAFDYNEEVTIGLIEGNSNSRNKQKIENEEEKERLHKKMKKIGDQIWQK